MLELINKGGLLIWPILLSSLIGTTIFFERLLRYRKILKQREHVANLFHLIAHGKPDEAKALLLRNPATHSASNRVVLEALSVEAPDRDTVEMVLIHGIEREMSPLSRYLDTLAVLGNTAPLLGLLGTVIGMIKAFIVVEQMQGSVNAAVLAGGIWEAMLTTALGLSVAIPLLFFHTHLQSQLHKIQENLEEVAIAFMKAWSKGQNVNQTERSPT